MRKGPIDKANGKDLSTYCKFITFRGSVDVRNLYFAYGIRSSRPFSVRLTSDTLQICKGIRSFKHRGLQALYDGRAAKRMAPEHVKKSRDILAVLERSDDQRY